MPTKTQPVRAGTDYQILPVADLTGGLDLRTNQSNLPSDRATRLVNFSLGEPGKLPVRPGFLRFSTSSLGNGRPQGGERVYLNTAIPSVNSTAFTLVGYTGKLYLLTDSGGWLNSTSVHNDLSTGNVLWFPYDRDLVAVFDGSTSPWKSTNGSSWTKMGIPAGSTALVASSVGSGSLSASEFEFGWTYKDRDLAHESNGSTALSTITMGATGAIKLVVDNSTHPSVDAFVIYARNKTAGESIRRKSSSQVQSTGTSSTITITSSNWTSNDEEPSDHDVPLPLSFGVVWKNRWWARDAIRKNRIRFTQLFQPQSWPALFSIDIPFERGDEIRALVTLGDALLVYGTTKRFVIFGQTSLDFEVRPALDSQDGAFGPRAVAVIESGVVHAGAAGVYVDDGTQDRLLNLEIEPGWRDLVKNAAIADLEQVAMVYHKTTKEIRVSVPRRFPSGVFGEFVLDLNRTRQQENRPAWTETDRTIGAYIHWDGPEASAGNRGRLFSLHSSMAQVFEESTGTSANSSAMTATYEGAGLNLGNARARWIDVRGEYQPSSGSLTLEALVDGVSQGQIPVTMAVAGAEFDEGGGFDVDAFGGGGRKYFHKTLPLSANGRQYVQRVTYTGQDAFALFTYSPGLRPEPRPRDFSEL